MSVRHKKIALWFRYGPAEHLELCHTIADVIERLSDHCEVHYFGMKSDRPVPEQIARHSTVHYLPFHVDRTSITDKTVKTFLWYMALPYLALKCRIMGINTVYIDETLPLTALLTRSLFGKNVAMTVADFFADIYFSRIPLLAPLRHIINTIDFVSWRRMQVIFTKTKSAREFLCTKGVPRENIYPVLDPCDTSLYHPTNKKAAKEQYGFNDNHLVIVHHGILHPNKGNDRILYALTDIKQSLPEVRYLLVGSGPDEQRLKKLSRELNLEEIVTFTGWLPGPKEVNIALNSADIGLVMRIGQQSDDFHVTGALVHNMACGLPILAANLAGVAEIIEDGKNGLLFSPHHMDEFKTKLLKLAHSPDLRARFGKEVLKLSQELFDVGKITMQIVNPLLKITGVEEDA